MIILNGNDLKLKDIHQIAREYEAVKIASENKKMITEASLFLERVSKEDIPVYGVNTGFGHMANVKIEKSSIHDLQTNLLKSHACGVGKPLKPYIVRAMMAMRINALIKGYSGIKVETLEKMVELLNADLIPVVFEKGSLGASGDLALLSHMSLPLIGLGEVYVEGVRMDANKGLKLKGIEPIKKLSAKEGLSLINGTQAMTAIGALCLYDAYTLYRAANTAFALTMESLNGIVDVLDHEIHFIRGHQGQIEAAKMMKNFLKGSRNLTHQGDSRVQDAYSLRCAPQVHGASLDVFEHVKKLVEIEMNAVTDNPLVFIEQEKILSAGNFHGQPMAMAFDYLALAIAELANISERRLERLVNPHLSNGLPPFLAKYSGLNSGFMIVQYSAASLVSENKILAHPASVDSIPSSANQEDHVSMGTIAARKAYEILENATQVVAMEIFAAVQALDFRGQQGLSIYNKNVYDLIRSHVPFLEHDTIMQPYIETIDNLIRTFKIDCLGDDLDA
jgi:histidine ammonia-lyase